MVQRQSRSSLPLSACCSRWPRTAGYRGAHFATFPEALVVSPLLATCPEAICNVCGQPWRRQLIVAGVVLPRSDDPTREPITRMGRGRLVPCGCDAPTRPGVVL